MGLSENPYEKQENSGTVLPLPAALPVDGDIVFDTVSGISEDEQREILAGIDGAAGKNRIHAPPVSLKTEAKKRGGLFPLLVNIGALVLLAAGFPLLYSFHAQDEPEIREGTAGLGTTERKLIQEIRRETASQINAKEKEIADVMSKLTGIDTEFQNLQSSIDKMLDDKETELRQEMNSEIEAERNRLIAQNLSEAAVAEQMRIFDAQRISRLNNELASYRQQMETEKQSSQANLQRFQEEYRNSLSVLQNERTQILEAARIQEVNLRAQLEEQVGELSGRYEQSRADLGAAREELRRLSDEQERTVLVEGQLSGFYAALNNQIRNGRFQEAAATLGLMRDFLNTPSFQNVRAIQSRKELYLAAIDALGNLVEENLRLRDTLGAGAPPPEAEKEVYESAIAALETQNAALEQIKQEHEKTIAAFNSQGSDLGRRLAEYESSVSALRTRTASLEQTLAERDNVVTALRTQSAAQGQQLIERDNAVAALRSQSAAQEQSIAERDNAIGELRARISGLEQTNEELRSRIETIQRLLNQ
jgi:chromosome segregation ATPase